MMTKKAKALQPVKMSNLPVEVNGKPSFGGVLVQFFEEIATYWNKDTRKAYISQYEKQIFPRLKEIPLEDYTKEDFQDLIEQIQKDAAEQGKLYSEGTLNHFRNLCRVVTKVAYKHDICDDVFWGTAFAEEEEEDKEHQEKTAQMESKIRQSFSETEEFALFKILFANPLSIGEYIGLAIMHTVGGRPQEECGLNYGNIVSRTVTGQTFYVLQIIATTKKNSNERKTSGKTKNAPRLLPIPDRLADLLLKRKAMLEEMIARDELEDVGPGKQFQGIDDLPIVCKGNNYTQRCSADDLCKKGKALLRKIKLDEGILIEISKYIDQVFVGENVQEKDETTYLMRRNFATKMNDLGATTGEMHYLMGHDMSEDGISSSKSRMTNPEELLHLKKIMEKRNYIGSAGMQTIETVTVNLDEHSTYEGISSVPCQIALHSSVQKRVLLIFDANEPEPGTVIVRKGSGSNCTGTIRTEMHSISRRKDALASKSYIEMGQQAKRKQGVTF